MARITVESNNICISYEFDLHDKLEFNEYRQLLGQINCTVIKQEDNKVKGFNKDLTRWIADIEYNNGIRHQIAVYAVDVNKAVDAAHDAADEKGLPRSTRTISVTKDLNS